MSILSPERLVELAPLRAKVMNGTVTIEELRRAVEIMRQGRLTAQQSSPKGRKTKEPINTDALFDELLGSKT